MNPLKPAALALAVLFAAASQAAPVTVKDASGRTFTVEAEPTETVAELKLKIQDHEGVSADRQRLVAKGKALEDGKTLADYAITADTVIYLSEPGSRDR